MGLIAMQYREAASFFRKRLCIPFIICAVVFFAAGALTYLMMYTDRELSEMAAQEIAVAFTQKGIVQDGNLSAFRLLVNNVVAALMALAMGLIPMLCLPMVSMALNAAVVGALAAFVVEQTGWGFMVMALLPHGIFELPALFLAAGLGVCLSLQLARMIIRSPRAMPFLEFLMEVARFFLLVVVPLLAAACLVEAYITPVLMGM